MMRQPTSSPMILAEGTEFSRAHRMGKVYRSSPDGCEVIWHELIDLGTGEVTRAISDFIPAEVIGREVSRGSLRILRLPPEMGPNAAEIFQERPPTAAELARASNRECYVLAAQKLIDKGTMKPVRADFVKNFDQLLGDGLREANARASRSARGAKCGTAIVMLRPPECGETIYRWWRPWVASSQMLKMDSFRNCGRRRGERYTDEEDEFYKGVIKIRLTEERPTIASICESVQAAVRCENERRMALPVPGTEFAVPGYDSVWHLIARMAPADHKVRRHGMEVAYRDLHTLGLGLRVTRVLERVELDEYTIDLMVLLRMLNLHNILTQEEALALGLDGTPRRLILSAAIDVYSGAIVGLQISRASAVDVTLRTIEMIYLDKQPLADAVGAEMPWPMHGQPQTLALDRASVNMSDSIYLRLSHAGITNLAVPAGKPFLKPWIERFFATFAALFLQRFTGRTFSNVVRKGENDPAARATVTLDEFLCWLTRWIVDIYHTRKPETLGKKSPLQTWNEAVSLSPPLVRADQAMLRSAFGITTTRKATRHGITVEDLRYQHEEIAKWFLNETERDLTVVWWDKKIGAIEVHLPDGRSVTAHCVDPQWADKSYADIVRQRMADKDTSMFGQGARDRATVEIDAFTREKAALRDLLPVIPTAEELATRTRDFSRYMVTAERTPETYGDIFDNEVQPFTRPAPSPADTQQSLLPLHIDAHDTGDIME
jgi:putative transposase